MFVLAPDDIVTVRGVRSPSVRDNVIFEAGVFVGAVGRKRAFMVIPQGRRKLRLPTYLADLTHATFDAAHVDGDLPAALVLECNRMRKLIKQLRRRRAPRRTRH